MTVSIQTLGRSVALAVLTAGAVMIGSSTAGATPVTQPTQNVATQQVSATNDTTAHTITATLPAGRFVSNAATHSIDIKDVAGKTTESIPMTLHGKTVPVAATISNNGRSVTLKQIAFTDTGNALINQWVWGVQHGGAVGAIIGCLLGFWFFVLPGCALGAAIGGAVGSPNSGQINATFFRLLSGN
ncbi:hypothetical protein [Nocardia macrotermitis]|uniref:DUF8020 domain-containing protein n=1 Tax=Nocardia macrotermitis TaxID=2585198 RepID=A0A7K0D1D0_9NOCA|nr:hypothetical protein [Nocardia macrotermitis]MQY19517.1 hypothetical protein [Nocardia macrotermitis]